MMAIILRFHRVLPCYNLLLPLARMQMMITNLSVATMFHLPTAQSPQLLLVLMLLEMEVEMSSTRQSPMQALPFREQKVTTIRLTTHTDSYRINTREVDLTATKIYDDSLVFDPANPSDDAITITASTGENLTFSSATVAYKNQWEANNYFHLNRTGGWRYRFK